jgi:broad specificity polyphosphatase/5'/3'-nucleotidase SurE
MHILITNDDGYLTLGIRILADTLSAIADITVVAPDRNKSGASNSLTLTRPLHGSPIYWVGPPGDAQDAGPGTDFVAIEQNQVWVTPLQVDLTRHGSINSLQHWLGNLT